MISAEQPELAEYGKKMFLRSTYDDLNKEISFSPTAKANYDLGIQAKTNKANTAKTNLKADATDPVVRGGLPKLNAKVNDIIALLESKGWIS